MMRMRCMTWLRRLFYISALVLLSEGNVSALDNPEKVIEETCEREWAHNSRMRAACIEQHAQWIAATGFGRKDVQLQVAEIRHAVSAGALARACDRVADAHRGPGLGRLHRLGSSFLTATQGRTDRDLRDPCAGTKSAGRR